MAFGVEMLTFPIALLTALGYMLKFGKRRLSSDDLTGLMLAMIISGPYGLFIFLAGYALGVDFGNIALSISFLASALVCGVVGGWVWVVVYARETPGPTGRART